MASNALSARRGPLRRPKVCTTPKNPGRCEPPPPTPLITCKIEIDPQSIPVKVGTDAVLLWDACHQNYTFQLMLVPYVFGAPGHILFISHGQNCSEGNEIFYQPPDSPGPVTVSLLVVFPDGSYCAKQLHFTVIEGDPA